jgi:parallel beta-helix repeat protein
VLEDRRLPSTFTVSSVLDDGSSGTLRSAMSQANSSGGSNTIQFSSEVFDSAQTITLTQGVLSLNSGTITIEGPGAGLLTINANDASRVFDVSDGVTASISGLTIAGGSTTGNGGGVYDEGTATFTDCAISGNTAVCGGGLYGDGSLYLIGCSLSGNSATKYGGGLYNQGLLQGESTVLGVATLTNCTISGNSANLTGGGLYSAGDATITDCAISDNSTTFGGGIWNFDAVTITGGTITNNTASQNGGGLCSFSGDPTLIDCTISGNFANMGGGLLNYKKSQSLLTHCTISGNSARYGGGLANYGTLDLTACTVSGNTAATSSGGIYNYWGQKYSGASTTLVDTIVAGNTDTTSTASDVGGTGASAVTGSYSMIGSGGSGGITGGSSGDIVLTGGASLGLAPLGDYGGPTQTIALLPGSPVIGAGSGSLLASSITTDQRDEPRTVNGNLDIGAFESQGFTLTTLAGGTPQSTMAGTAFSSPLEVSVAAVNPDEPVADGVVMFTINPASDGASATLSTVTAVINADGTAQLNATANSLGGDYTITATTAGAVAAAEFSLTNQVQPVFSELADQTMTFGTASATFTGILSAGSQAPRGRPSR